LQTVALIVCIAITDWFCEQPAVFPRRAAAGGGDGTGTQTGQMVVQQEGQKLNMSYTAEL